MHIRIARTPLVCAALLSVVATSALAQNAEGKRRARREINNANVGTRVRGSVVRVSPADQLLVVKTLDGREVSFYAQPRTVYRLNAPDATLATLQTGANVDIVYETRGGQSIIETVSLQGADDRGNVDATNVGSDRGSVRVRGRIVQVANNPPRLVLRDESGKEIAVMLDESRDIALTVEQRAGVYYLAESRAAVSGPGTSSTPVATSVQGTIVRIMPAENQFVLRTEKGEEIVFYGEPKSTFRIDNQDAQFTAIREGTWATVNYDVRGKRKFVRAFEASARRGNR